MEAENRMNDRKKFLLDIAYLAVIIAIVFLVFKYLISLLMPFFLALILAAAARPLSRLLSSETRLRKNAAGEKVPVRRRLRMNSTLAGIVSVVVLFLVIGGLLTFIVIRVADTIIDLVATIPDLYYDTLAPAFTAALSELESVAGRVDESVVELVRGAIPNVISSIGSALTNLSARVVGWATTFATKLPSFLLNTVICLIATVFIAVDFDFIRRFIRRNLPERALRIAVNIKDSFVDIIWQFLKSYFIIFCITCSEITVGLLIIGMDHPLLLGVLIAIFDAFPVVGSGMILLPWSLITLVTGETWRGVGLLILYATVVIVRQVIEPKIVGKQVGLRPLVTLMCMYAGTRLFGGLIGLFGLPITAAILTDLNNRGTLHIFKRAEPESEPAAEDTGHAG